MVFLATVGTIRMNVWMCCGIASGERSPNREMEGERGMLRLRIMDSPLIASDQNSLTGVHVQNAWKWLSITVGQ